MNISSLLRMLVLAALWGGSFLFMRIVAPVLGAVPTAFGRVLLGALGLFFILLVLQVPRSFNKKLAASLALGVLNSGVPFLLFSFAARALPAGYSAILNATTPLMGVIMGTTLFGEPWTWQKALGVLLGLMGVTVMTQTGTLSWSMTLFGGVAACLAATTCYGLAGFLTKRWITQRGGLDSRLVAFGSQLGPILVLLPFAAWEAMHAPIAWQAVDAKVWLSMLALGFLCTSFAYILYFRLIADVGPMKALTVTFLIPLFGVLWGWLLLNETPSIAYVWGGLFIGAALWLVLRPAASISNSAGKLEKNV